MRLGRGRRGAAVLRGSRRGFTIIELAIVLFITAILAALAVSVYGKMTNKARFTQARVALKHLQKTEMLYFTDFGRYTDNAALLDFDPVKYDYYVISVAVDNTGMNFAGYADGVKAMAGDRWHITRDGDPVHDTPDF